LRFFEKKEMTFVSMKKNLDMKNERFCSKRINKIFFNEKPETFQKQKMLSFLFFVSKNFEHGIFVLLKSVKEPQKDSFSLYCRNRVL